MGVGEGEGEGVMGSIRTASKERGVGFGFAWSIRAKTWVVARRGTRKVGMLEIRIVNVDLRSFVLSSKCGRCPWSPRPLSDR